MTRRAKGREAWIDLLRILAAFFVIVNHTNSDVFRMSDPAHGTWWASMLWYYLSKLAVPLFVMASGACLLDRLDGYRRVLRRILRVLGALVVFSYGYFLHDAWVNYGLWPRMVDFGAFFRLVWTQKITDSFWYLYFYLGLMAMLPFLQRMAANMRGRDLGYFIGLCFVFGAIWPLIVHYVPEAALPSYLDLPLFTGYLGLFFAGHWIRSAYRPTRRRAACALGALLVSLAASVLLTRLEFDRVAAGAKYWFMDDRMRPSIFTIAGAVCALMLLKGLPPFSQRTRRVLGELGGCAFGIYLLQDWLIAQSKTRLFLPMAGTMPAFAAVVLWEIAVFVIALVIAWLLRRVPLLRRVL